MKLERLRGRKICDRVMRRGILLKGRTMNVRALLGSPRHPHADAKNHAVYVGTVASTKLDKSAVKRNRMRRRCREAWRITLRERAGTRSVQLLIMPRSSRLKAPFEELQKDVSTFLATIHTWHLPSEIVSSSLR